MIVYKLGEWAVKTSFPYKIIAILTTICASSSSVFGILYSVILDINADLLSFWQQFSFLFVVGQGKTLLTP